MKTGKLTPKLSSNLMADTWVKEYEKTNVALDSYTKLLIHGDSIGDATGKTVTSGGAVVSTSQYKFNEIGSSIYFDGSNDYLSLDDSADWDMGNGDFTIDWRFKAGSLKQQFVYSQAADADNKFDIYYENDGRLTLEVRTGAANKGVYIWTGAYSDTNWHHYAVVRTTTSAKLFVDGVQNTSVTESTAFGTNTIGDIEAALTIGKRGYAEGYLNGYIDEFRISKGIARWTADFTPPTAPYDGARTSLVIPDLDGDTDEEYELTVRQIGGSSTATNFLLTFNGDTAANYGSRSCRGYNATTLDSSGVTNQNYVQFPQVTNTDINTIMFGRVIIYAKKGYSRLVFGTIIDKTSATTISALSIFGQSWNNTADNITKITLAANQTNGLGIGTYVCLMKKVRKAV